MAEGKRMNTLKIRDTVHRLVGMLVAEDYAGLEAASRGRRLTAAQLRQAVEEYGRKLRMPPESVFEVFDEDNLDVYELASPRSWAVLVPLWTVEEGRSDLTLELVLTDKGEEHYDIEIHDLHVL